MLRHLPACEARAWKGLGWPRLRLDGPGRSRMRPGRATAGPRNAAELGCRWPGIATRGWGGGDWQCRTGIKRTKSQGWKMQEWHVTDQSRGGGKWKTKAPEVCGRALKCAEGFEGPGRAMGGPGRAGQGGESDCGDEGRDALKNERTDGRVWKWRDD